MDQMWINFLVSWAPFLLLVILWIGFAWMFRRRGLTPSGRTTAELCEQQLEEMKRQVEEAKRHTTALERIAKALENRGRE
ncbi:MAG TPA: hypothetical protein VGJ20_11610 [Xanthobacteraceae bacterium]|jgi:hypothetical protein